MNVHDATEIAYQNGYEQAQKDAVMSDHQRLVRLLGEAIAYGVKYRNSAVTCNEYAAQYLMAHGVTLSLDKPIPVYTLDELAKRYGKFESVRTN